MKITKVIIIVIILSLMMAACGTKDRENINDKELETTNIKVKETQEESYDDEFVESTENQTEIVADDSIIDSTEQLTNKEIETTTNVANIDTSVVETVKPIETQPATEPVTTSKPVQPSTVAPTETTKQCAHTACGNSCTHTHSWQPVYETITVSEAWSEPVYAVRAWYEWIFGHKCLCDVCVNSPYYTKMYNTPSLKYDENGLPTIVEADFIGNGVDLTAAYNAWLAEDGVGCYGDGSWRDFGTEIGTYGYACNTAFVTMYAYYGETEQLVSYIQHDAVTEMYIDYYDCADNSCGATKEGDR